MAVICSLADHVDAAVKHQNKELLALLATEFLNRVQKIAGRLPSTLSDFWGFESRLGETDPSVDFLLCVKSVTGGLSVLSSFHVLSVLDQIAAPVIVSDGIARLCDVWRDERPEKLRIDNVWLEFDCGSSSTPNLVPCVFFGTYGLTVDNTNSVADVFPSFMLIVNSISSTPVSSLQEHSIQRCFRCLSAGSTVFQTGVMLSRDGNTIRLCVRGVSPHNVVSYLRRIGWNGDTGNVELALNRYASLAEHVDIDLDVNETIADRIGLELWFDHELDAHRSKWPPLLNRLLDDDLCTVSKHRALQHWPAFAAEKDDALWPADLKACSDQLGPDQVSAMIRWLHHIKIVVSPSGPLSAKGYLGVRQFWPSTFDIRRSVFAKERAWTIAAGCGENGPQAPEIN